MLTYKADFLHLDRLRADRLLFLVFNRLPTHSRLGGLAFNVDVNNPSWVDRFKRR